MLKYNKATERENMEKKSADKNQLTCFVFPFFESQCFRSLNTVLF